MTEDQTDGLDWLDHIKGDDALAWVNAQNQRTEAHLKDERFHEDVNSLRTALSCPDKTPVITRIADYIYNFWTDSSHAQGIWRRIPYDDLIRGQRDWETLLDLDQLSQEEGIEFFWDGVDVLPSDHSRAIVHLSEGGADAAQLREWSFVDRAFVENGFSLGAAVSSVEWLDANTLLLMSSYGGDDHATVSGEARTVRVWRRGQPVAASKTIFSTARENDRVRVARDWTFPEMRLHLTEIIDGDKRRLYVARDDFHFERVDIPQDIRFKIRGDWVALHLREEWTLDGDVLPMDSLIVTKLDKCGVVACPRVLWASADGGALVDFQFINGRVCFNLLRCLRPVIKLYTNGPTGWSEDLFPPLINDGVISVHPLAQFAHEEDDAVIVTEESPLLPRRISLATLASSDPPLLLRQSGHVFNAAGMNIEYHQAVLKSVGSVPYAQVGRARSSMANMPLYMYGYGGFGATVQLSYNKILGVLALQHGWTVVITCLPGDGSNGLHYESLGRKNGKSLAHDAFAAIASHLVERGVARSRDIVAAGASNGGLMAGMMLSRFPQHFTALACELPLTDLERFKQWSAGQSWSSEYPPRLEDRLRISPCHCVTEAAADSPQMLVFTNRLDDRVHPAHARRYAYILQQHGHSCLFFESQSGGHGYGANVEQIAEYFALRNSFYRQAIASRA